MPLPEESSKDDDELKERSLVTNTRKRKAKSNSSQASFCFHDFRVSYDGCPPLVKESCIHCGKEERVTVKKVPQCECRHSPDSCPIHSEPVEVTDDSDSEPPGEVSPSDAGHHEAEKALQKPQDGKSLDVQDSKESLLRDWKTLVRSWSSGEGEGSG